MHSRYPEAMQWHFLNAAYLDDQYEMNWLTAIYMYVNYTQPNSYTL